MPLKISEIEDHALADMARYRRAQNSVGPSNTHREFLDNSFVFTTTPEGHDFWSDVNRGKIVTVPTKVLDDFCDEISHIDSDVLLTMLPKPYRERAMKYTENSIEDARLSDFYWDRTQEGFEFWSNVSRGKFYPIPEYEQPKPEGHNYDKDVVTENPFAKSNSLEKPLILIRGYEIVGAFDTMSDVLDVVEEDPEPSAFILVDTDAMQTASFTPKTSVALNWQ